MGGTRRSISRSERLAGAIKREEYRKAGTWGALAVAILVAALLSPLLLTVLSKQHADWATLSNVGQAYGVVSAIALVGVAASIIFQARQEKAQRIQMVRDYHLELRRIALENPEVYMPCWRPIEAPDLDLNGRRQHLYLHLTMNYAWLSFSVGVMNREGLQDDLCAGIFEGHAGRDYWKEARKIWQQTPGNRRRRQFISLVDDAYERAKKSDPKMGRTLGNSIIVAPSASYRTRVAASQTVRERAGLSAFGPPAVPPGDRGQDAAEVAGVSAPVQPVQEHIGDGQL